MTETAMTLEAAKAAVVWAESLEPEGWGAADLTACFGAVAGEIWVHVGPKGPMGRLFKVTEREHLSAHGVLEGVGFGVAPAALPGF